jgi:hypothetical protein
VKCPLLRADTEFVTKGQFTAGDMTFIFKLSQHLSHSPVP